MWDLDEHERRSGKSGTDLWILDMATGCGDGVDKRLREKGLSPSLSYPIFGKTEVTRELD
jgi:hypothetical protein